MAGYRIVETPFTPQSDGFGNPLKWGSRSCGEPLVWDESPAAHASCEDEALRLAVEEWKTIATSLPEGFGEDHDWVTITVMELDDLDEEYGELTHVDFPTDSPPTLYSPATFT